MVYWNKKQLAPLVLFVLWPFAHFAATNIAKEISWQRFLLIVLITVLISLIGMFVAHLIARKIRVDRLSITFGVAFGCLFLFNLTVATPLRGEFRGEVQHLPALL